MTEVVGVVLVVKAAVVAAAAAAAVTAPARVSVLVFESARTELSELRLQLERLVQEFEVSVLALKVVSGVSVPSQGLFLSSAALRPLELLGLLINKSV